MKFFYSPQYEVDLGEHILPTTKFRFVKERLIESKIAEPRDFEEPPPPRMRPSSWFTRRSIWTNCGEGS